MPSQSLWNPRGHRTSSLGQQPHTWHWACPSSQTTPGTDGLHRTVPHCSHTEPAPHRNPRGYRPTIESLCFLHSSSKTPPHREPRVARLAGEAGGNGGAHRGLALTLLQSSELRTESARTAWPGRGRDGTAYHSPERRHQQQPLATVDELQKTTHDMCSRRASCTRNNCLSQSFNHQGCYEKLTFLPLD